MRREKIRLFFQQSWSIHVASKNVAVSDRRKFWPVSLLADRFERFVSPGISSYRLYQSFYRLSVYSHIFAARGPSCTRCCSVVYLFICDCGAIIFTIRTAGEKMRSLPLFAISLNISLANSLTWNVSVTWLLSVQIIIRYFVYQQLQRYIIDRKTWNALLRESHNLSEKLQFHEI